MIFYMYKHGKLNIQLTAITQTPLTWTVFRFPLEFEVPEFYCISSKKYMLYPRLSKFQGKESSKRQDVLSKAACRSGALIPMSI